MDAPIASAFIEDEMESGKTLVFITNNFSLPAATIGNEQTRA